MRIKHAYNTLLNKSDRRFDKGNRGSESSYSTAGRNDNWTVNNDEEFYGFGKIYLLLEILCCLTNEIIGAAFMCYFCFLFAFTLNDLKL